MRTTLGPVLVLLSACTTVQGAAPSATERAESRTQASSTRDARAELHRLFDEEWQYQLEQNPVMASSMGDKRWNDKLGDNSLAAVEKQKAHARQLLARLEQFDRTGLSEEDQLNLDLFTRDFRDQVEEHKFPGEVIVLSSQRGPHMLVPQLAQIVPLESEQDYADFIKRLEQLPTAIDNAIERMQKGLELGVTPTRISVRNAGANIALQVPPDVKRSPGYLRAFGKKPARIDDAKWADLQRRGEEAIARSVYPAIKKLHTFWNDTYFPKTRESVAMSSLPNGAAWYAQRARSMTTTALTPDQIHELGLAEVKRIRAEMEKTKEQAGFKGPLPEFFKQLRTDPRFFFTDKTQLLMTYRDIAKRIDAQLPRLFGKLPRLPYGVEPVPEYAEKTSTTAYYNPGSIEAGRPGIYFANTYDLKSRPKWEMEALTAHEGVPGHHLQIALAQELEDLPRFRRHGHFSAFVEGWGLYSESLGTEIGLYADPHSKAGQLTYEMWRAVRLVVDTGLHMKGWSREQAIQYFLENTPKTQHDIEVEVDRYITNPAQALAYKIGELKIKELRAYAEKALGDAFDIRAFHDTVLGAGPLPLDVLEKRVRAQVAKLERSRRAPPLPSDARGRPAASGL